MLFIDQTYAAAELAYRRQRLMGHRDGQPVHHVPTTRRARPGELRERLIRAAAGIGRVVSVLVHGWGRGHAVLLSGCRSATSERQDPHTAGGNTRRARWGR